MGSNLAFAEETTDAEEAGEIDLMEKFGAAGF